MCLQAPSTYLVWQRGFDRWWSGDVVPLCVAHGAVMRARIRRAEVSGCDLLAAPPTGEARVHCGWESAWPLTDAFRVIQV